MDPEKRSRNLFVAVLIIAALAVGLFKLYLYRSALAESFQPKATEDDSMSHESVEAVSQP